MVNTRNHPTILHKYVQLSYFTLLILVQDFSYFQTDFHTFDSLALLFHFLNFHGVISLNQNAHTSKQTVYYSGSWTLNAVLYTGPNKQQQQLSAWLTHYTCTHINSWLAQPSLATLGVDFDSLNIINSGNMPTLCQLLDYRRIFINLLVDIAHTFCLYGIVRNICEQEPSFLIRSPRKRTMRTDTYQYKY